MTVKTAVVAYFHAYPPGSGASQVAWNVAKNMLGERYLIQFGVSGSRDVYVEDVGISDLGYLPEGKSIKVLTVCKRLPRLGGILNRIDPDLIILEGAASLYCLLAFLVIRALRLRAKVIYHAYDVEYLLRKERGKRFYSFVAKWATGILLRRADLSFAVSDVDAGRFSDIYGIRPLVLPNGVDMESFARVTAKQIQAVAAKYGLKGKTVLFMGLTSYPPNREGIAFLVQSVFPRVVAQDADARLVIIGGKVPYEEKWLINPGKIPYEDIPAFVKACDVCVAPIFSGSGTRIKILEYMAAGRPTVSTTKGAEGIKGPDGIDILLADDTEAFANAILTLLNDSRRAQRLGERGEALVRSNYSWPTIMRDFEHIAMDCLAKRVKQP